ncbi:hypothetical protein AK830_g320 [Neonectria ditissima]|uniref:RRM domain-containing protein n=1 Tax=Neonectria ditissima TaxID=78410 RepID=A0A0P7BLN7_9HYPO|nr:hypothetical protein AK830_g320 [Neonectria ditissima]
MHTSGPNPTHPCLPVPFGQTILESEYLGKMIKTRHSAANFVKSETTGGHRQVNLFRMCCTLQAEWCLTRPIFPTNRLSTNQPWPPLKLSGAHSHGPAAVYISQAEYDGLVKVAHQYARLRQNLLRGGIEEETIAILSSEDPSLEANQTPAASQDYSTAGQYGDGAKATFLSNSQHTRWGQTRGSVQDRHRDGRADFDAPSESVSMSIDSSVGGVPLRSSTTANSMPRGPQLDRIATRTIHLSNLADGVTHADITEAVRGGQVLEIYLRPRDRTATVSFVYGEDAKAFYARARQADLYIKNKRVDLRWGDRQFVLAGHVAHKLNIGASRNLVIRNCDPNHTEEAIRDDLEHIHNLVVIDVNFVRGDCFISTNSVHNAMFARTCMMSRGKYRGSRIQWAADECAQPLAEIPALRRSTSTASTVKTQPDHMSNRFQVLDLSDDKDFIGDGSIDDDDDDSDDTLH